MLERAAAANPAPYDHNNLIMPEEQQVLYRC